MEPERQRWRFAAVFESSVRALEGTIKHETRAAAKYFYINIMLLQQGSKQALS
jgi:hypothetical protein